MNKSSVKQNIIQPNSFSCLLRTQKFAAQEIIIPRASSSGKQSEDRSDYGRLSLTRSPTNVRDNTPFTCNRCTATALPCSARDFGFTLPLPALPRHKSVGYSRNNTYICSKIDFRGLPSALQSL